MERLSDLPPVEDTDITPQESSVMQKYFSTPAPEKKIHKPGWLDTIKMSFYAAMLFVILANPWIDSIVCMLPYCGDSALSLLFIKAMIFAIVFTVMNRYFIH